MRASPTLALSSSPTAVPTAGSPGEERGRVVELEAREAPTRLEHAHHLVDASDWVGQVLQHPLGEAGIDRSVAERDRFGFARQPAHADTEPFGAAEGGVEHRLAVQRDHGDARVGLCEPAGLETDAASDVKHGVAGLQRQ
jgi:hypothetical protein